MVAPVADGSSLFSQACTPPSCTAKKLAVHTYTCIDHQTFGFNMKKSPFAHICFCDLLLELLLLVKPLNAKPD